MYKIEQVQLPDVNTGVLKTRYVVFNPDGSLRRIWANLKGAQKQVNQFNKIRGVCE